jgi:hypothetical protein
MGITKLLCVQGYRDAKADFRIFRDIRRKEDSDRTLEEMETYELIKW